MESLTRRSGRTRTHLPTGRSFRLDPELQYTTSTSLTARKAGEVTGTSPAKIDHLIRGFFGTLGVYSVMLADQAVKKAGDYPDVPTRTWRQMPVVRAFVHDPDSPHSRSLSEFYNFIGKARRAEASYKRYEGEAADRYFEQHKEEIAGARDANRAARHLAKLRSENREIMASKKYSESEKAKLIGENNRLIKELSRDFVKENARP